MLEFSAGTFAMAGLIAAAGPVIIHLLNRRRYRVVEWGAMDFLREAVERNRRILHIRDLVLLALRTLCILLFGLAMARPYFSRGGTIADSGQPVHAVLVIDNSGSMGYERIEGTLLDQAKSRALEFIERLPQGSRISIIPLCGSAIPLSRDPYRTPEDARDALARIEVVDRSGTAAQAADLAVEACAHEQDLPAKRVVFISDQQAINWPGGALAEQFKNLPEMQIVSVTADDLENAWIASFRLQDEIADVETPAVFLATIRYEGSSPRPNVPVTLIVDETEVATQTIDLEPGQTREVRFSHRFELPIEPGQEGFVSAAVSIPADRLPADDKRFLAVPIVAALPVLFVDQYGEDESPAQGRYGETFHLRRLLAPVTARGDVRRQLVQVRHRTIEELSKQELQDARLVVIAGVERPGETVPLLREYVEQGGQLVIAAGAEFDPEAWSTTAWLDGAGILPLPLNPQSIGRLPDEAARLEPFFLMPETMTHDYFRIEEASREELFELYRTPFFFKAVVLDASANIVSQLLRSETERIAGQRQRLTEINARQVELAEKRSQDTLSSDEQRQWDADEQERRELAPAWLLFGSEGVELLRDATPEQLAQRQQPHVLASFTNQAPFLVERKMGRGEVLFISTGLHSPWNNLTKTNAVLIFDRILRDKLASTLPRRNFSTTDQVLLPIAAADRRAEFTLHLADDRQEALSVDAVGSDEFGISLRDTTQRGIYRIVARKPRVAAPRGASIATPDSAETKLWEMPIVLNGPERESELQPINAAVLSERLSGATYRWVGADDTISMEGAQVTGHDMWKWLMLSVLLCLLVEVALLAWPDVRKEAAA